MSPAAQFAAASSDRWVARQATTNLARLAKGSESGTLASGCLFLCFLCDVVLSCFMLAVTLSAAAHPVSRSLCHGRIYHEALVDRQTRKLYDRLHEVLTVCSMLLGAEASRALPRIHGQPETDNLWGAGARGEATGLSAAVGGRAARSAVSGEGCHMAYEIARSMDTPERGANSTPQSLSVTVKAPRMTEGWSAGLPAAFRLLVTPVES